MLGHPSLSPRACEAPAVALVFLCRVQCEDTAVSSHTELLLVFHIAALGTDPVDVCELAIEREESSICLSKGPWVWHSLRNPSNTATHLCQCG